MVKHVKRFIKILLAVIILMLSMPSVKAASARIKASSTSVYVGDSVTITATYTAAAWNLTISGNGVTTAKYADVTADAENATKTASVKLNTSKAGTYTVKLTGDITDGTTGNTTNVNTSVTVTVKEKLAETTKEKTVNDSSANSGNSSTGSTNSSTKNTTTNNNASTPATTSAAKSTAASSNNKTTKTTTSSTNTNKTNEAQVKKTEEITETKIEEVEIQEETLPFGISELKVYGINENNEKEQIIFTPKFDINIFEYKCNVKSNISKIEVEKNVNNYDEYLEIIGLDKDLKEGENTIIFRMNKDDKSLEYKLIITKEPEIKVVVEDVNVEENEVINVVEEDNKFEEIFDSIKVFMNKHGLYIGITITLMAVEAAVFIVVIKKKYVRKNNEEI